MLECVPVELYRLTNNTHTAVVSWCFNLSRVYLDLGLGLDEAFTPDPNESISFSARTIEDGVARADRIAMGWMMSR